jgi:glycosyltransferase involved in cell wall biosynthesis
MRESDFFVLPSLWENQPCVLNEALSCGLPILATRIGGIPEMLDDQTGLLVPPGDVAALTDALCKALNHEIHFDQKRIAQAAMRYQPETVGNEILEVYQDALS